MRSFMNAMDSVAGSQAEAYITTADGNRQMLMQLINFESTTELEVSEVPILGKTGKGHKPNGWTGSWSATAHYNQSIFRQILLEYKKSGRIVPFDIQIINEDPSSSVGRQTIILKNCLINGGVLAKFDADAELLDEEIEGTFDDWEMPEVFNKLRGVN